MQIRYETDRHGLYGLPYEHILSYRASSKADATPAFAPIGPEQLGYLARCVLIDNPTGQWFYCPAAGVHIPPNRTMMCLILPSGSQVASIYPETPVGQSSTPVAGQIITAVYTAMQLPASAGV